MRRKGQSLFTYTAMESWLSAGTGGVLGQGYREAFGERQFLGRVVYIPSR